VEVGNVGVVQNDDFDFVEDMLIAVVQGVPLESEFVVVVVQCLFVGLSSRHLQKRNGQGVPSLNLNLLNLLENHPAFEFVGAEFVVVGGVVEFVFVVDFLIVELYIVDVWTSFS
jgi:hypothetical protein